MADSERDDLRDIATLLAQSTRELNDAATRVADAIGSQANTSNITIQAGGVTNAVAVCVSLASTGVMMLFAIWMMWQQAEQKSQQEAWIQVWQQRIANEARK